MELLPPIGWADVATTTDLDHVQAALSADIEHLRSVMDARLEAVDFKLDAEISDLRSQMVTLFKDAQRWQLTALATVTAILGLLIRFT